MSRVGMVQCPILVGRDDLLAHGDRLIADVLQGHGRTVFYSGQAGLGKTRLIRAIVRKAESVGFRFLGGAVAPQDDNVPLGLIRDLAVSNRADKELGTLCTDLLAIDVQQEGDSLGARRLMVRAIADRILEAIDRPTVLRFADIHWADEMSLEVIGELARRAPEKPLLLIAEYRGDELPTTTIHREWRARLLSQRFAEEVKLRRLTLEETAVATTLILGGDLPAPRDVVEAVHQRTNGIPFHIEELLAALEPEDRTEGHRILDAHVPDTIGDAILARLGRLSVDARTVARAGAVLGRCFSPDVMAGVVGRPLVEIEPAIAELHEASFLFPFDYIDQGYYDYPHQLLRDAIYAATPPSELRRYHAQAAEFVMTLEASSIVHVSRHYDRAGLRPQAYQASLMAAREAGRISARKEAFELFERAIANMPADLPMEEQAELYEQFADAAAAIERNDECVGAIHRARELYLAAGRPLAAAELILSLSVMAERVGDPHAELQSLGDRLSTELEALPASREREAIRARSLGRRAEERLLAMDLVAARELGHQARELAESIEQDGQVVQMDLLMARIDILGGRYASGFRDGLKAAREARDAGLDAIGVTAYRNLSILAARVMDPKTAEIMIGDGLAYADVVEQHHCRQMLSTTRGLMDWAAGRWDAALDRARQELADRGCTRGTTGAKDVLGLVALGRGQTDVARRWLQESLAAGERIGEVQFILTPMWGLAEAELLAGDPDGAAARCADAWEIASETGERALFIPFVVTGVRSLLAARKPDVAERWLARAREHLAGWESVAGPALSHAEGLLKLASGSFSSAREALERAVRGWDERGRIWEALWARLDLASCLVRMNRPADAADAVALVQKQAQVIGSEPLLARSGGLAKANRRRGLEDEPWRPLTAREFEVARAIGSGMTNVEIAAELFVAPKTVSAHVEHILAKLGVSRRAEIATWVASVRPVDRPSAGTTGPQVNAVTPS